MPPVSVTLLSKPGCHLCDDARAVVSTVVDGRDVEVTELSILDDPQLRETYAEEIPVVLVDGRVHTIWRVDPARLDHALTEAGS
ncbi:glutaredoxin family protein [Galbitalea sp. SE-J8]|uniref:glutaredoxin family protein n=1 Tax=Galbitalea sp. SE-J8 TaxID=3054952 RepID=UPI00259CD455|nr:glutaredoxin family protein [Galbitalea sp. SE-J8]MDM4762383.1 glutaredoxin family protein [Galbitalea sp. SE-J8]